MAQGTAAPRADRNTGMTSCAGDGSLGGKAAVVVLPPLGPASAPATGPELLSSSLDALADGVVRCRIVGGDRPADLEVVLANRAARDLLNRRGVTLEPGMRLASIASGPVSRRDLHRYVRVVLSGRPLDVVDHGDDGHPDVEVHAVPVDGDVVITLRDVTLRASEQRRREADARFRTAFDRAPIGIMLLDPAGAVLQANGAVHAMLGYEADALVGMSALELTHPDDRSRTTAQLEALRSGTSDHLRGEKRYLTADGEARWVALSSSTVPDDDGGCRQVIVHVQDVTERRRIEAQLRFEAERDPLTGLLNRRAFDDCLSAVVGAPTLRRPLGALLALDLDGFKSLNDELGHGAGDQALAATAEVLLHAVRTTDAVARLGGDEFAVLLPGARCEPARRIATAIVAGVAALDIRNSRGPLTASVGIALVDGTGADPDALLDAADLAMYEAKRAGGNQWSVAEPAGAHPRLPGTAAWGRAADRPGGDVITLPGG